MASAPTHGILDPRSGEAYFTLERREPAADLVDVVERYWSVRWSLHVAKPFAQETLPHPNVNLVFGTHRPGIHGVASSRFIARLAGEGWVIGVKFRPAGFFPFFGRDVSVLRERELAIAEVFGQPGASLEAAVMNASTDDARIALVTAFLRSFDPVVDDLGRVTARAVEIARADPSIARVSELAARVGVSTRTLDRLFRRHVGVGPKWVVRRYRVHEACERIVTGAPPCWSSLAQELGYFDQAHFIRDFKAQVGVTPAAYAARCRKA